MTTKIIGAIAGTLLLAGLVVGLIPVHADGANCGSAYHPSSDIYVATLNGIDAQEHCGSLRSIIRIPAITLTALGGIGLLAAAVLAGSDKRTSD